MIQWDDDNYLRAYDANYRAAAGMWVGHEELWDGGKKVAFVLRKGS